jgi:periplasmic divalent cation tolerance protein
MQFIEIHWTTGSLEEARRVSRYLVQERIAAHAEIIPWIESIQLLDNQLETGQESKILLIAALDRFDEIKELLEKNCSYEIPEITYRLIDG